MEVLALWMGKYASVTWTIYIWGICFFLGLTMQTSSVIWFWIGNYLWIVSFLQILFWSRRNDNLLGANLRSFRFTSLRILYVLVSMCSDHKLKIHHQLVGSSILQKRKFCIIFLLLCTFNGLFHLVMFDLFFMYFTF